jgi:hypothetical protein
MEPLVMNVTIIQYLLLLLILFPDSNVESSNMASLESGVCYLFLDTAGTANVPGYQNAPQKACSTYIRTTAHMQNVASKIVQQP